MTWFSTLKHTAINLLSIDQSIEDIAALHLLLSFGSNYIIFLKSPPLFTMLSLSFSS
jgi:hypothetical protein